MPNLQALMNKIFLMIGRGILKAIDDSGKTQLLQITALNKENISDVERPQQYGLATFPTSSMEAVIAFINGNRDHGIALIVSDRDNRPDGLKPGDVHVWSNKDLVLNTGDAASWVPNTLAVDPFTGLAHGGAQAGIVKLQGK